MLSYYFVFDTIYDPMTTKTLLFILLALLAENLQAFTSAPNNALPKLDAAVLVPGFLTGEEELRSMEKSLNERGIPTVTVPMPAWHWIPVLGGRSVRPILERIDYTVRHVAAGEAVPDMKYSARDCWEDFLSTPGGTLKVGGTDNPDDYPPVEPRGEFPKAGQPKGKIGLIGFSAGGWISRIYLSNEEYGGKAYNGQNLVHSLVTLGTPHGDNEGPAFSGVGWCNRKDKLPLRQLAVGGTGFKGDEWGLFTLGSYAFCGANDCDGDGVTPIDSSLALPGAEKMKIPGASHFCWSNVAIGSLLSPELTKHHQEAGDWYGSENMLDRWLPWLARRA